MPSPASHAAGLPITLGSLLDFPRDPIACMHHLSSSTGIWPRSEENSPPQDRVCLGPEYNQRILSDTKTFTLSSSPFGGPKTRRSGVTCGLLSMNGEDHKRNRRIVMGPFQKRSIDRYRDSLVGLVEQMLAREWRPGQVRNIFADMTQFMLRVTSSILFGFDRTDLAYSIGQKTERWVQLNHEMGIGSLLPAARDAAGYERLLAQARELEQEIVRMVEFRRSSSDEGNDVLSLLIRRHDDQGVGLTDDELIGQAAGYSSPRLTSRPPTRLHGRCFCWLSTRRWRSHSMTS